MKATIPANMDDLCNYIDSHLLLDMGEKKLREFRPKRTTWLLKGKALKNIEDTIFILDRGEHQLTMLLVVSQNVGNKRKQYTYGSSIRSADKQECDIYIERYHKAVDLGIIPKDHVAPHMTLRRTIGAVLIFVLLVAAAMLPVFILTMIFMIILSPFIYIMIKREEKRIENNMSLLLSIFSEEFNRKATKAAN